MEIKTILFTCPWWSWMSVNLIICLQNWRKSDLIRLSQGEMFSIWSRSQRGNTKLRNVCWNCYRGQRWHHLWLMISRHCRVLRTSLIKSFPALAIRCDFSIFIIYVPFLGKRLGHLQVGGGTYIFGQPRKTNLVGYVGPTLHNTISASCTQISMWKCPHPQSNMGLV